MTYDQHQRHAIRLICQVCLKPYDVTNTQAGSPFICVWCRPRRSDEAGIIDASGRWWSVDYDY